jgi:acyl carrier protein
METNKIKLVKSLLAEMLGVDMEDINEEDSFTDDLHMGASEISDFLEKLDNSGIDPAGVNIKETETITDLIDVLGLRDDED